MSLEEYKKKRNFRKTNEPSGSVKKSERSGSIFVIQEHHASHLHWDLRLEMDGVLRSWAIPKDPPLKPGIRRLAIQTEDHPLEYADFEGLISEGQYGAGEVKIWDRGTFELESLHDDKMVVIMSGARMKGAYILLRFRPKTGDGRNTWLFFRRK